MDVLGWIIKIILCIFAVFLIIVVLLQSGKGGVGGGALGGAELAMGKSKARGLDALLAKLTKVAAIGFMVLSVAMVLIVRFWS